MIAILLFVLLGLNGATSNPGFAEEWPSQQFYNPFQIHIDPMERLLLVNIENDPDSLYIGFEPQVFNDSINGSGMLVIAWRTDGFVDVYHQHSLQLNAAKYDIAGKGLKNMISTSLEGAYFQVEEQGVQAWFQMEDIMGRNIEILIHEKNQRKRKPFGLLAPMGHAAQNPSAMPLVLLHDFYFVRQNYTDISILIEGRKHMPDKLPLPIDRQKMLFARYSPDPLIATLNPAHNGMLPPVMVQDSFTARQGNTHILLEAENRIKSLQSQHNHHTINLIFDPAFPDISTIKENETMSGKFSVRAHSSTGYIAGRYEVSGSNEGILISMTPHKGWKPKTAGKASLRFLYTVAGIFRNWPKTYQWDARIIFNDAGQPHMQSGWRRITE